MEAALSKALESMASIPMENSLQNLLAELPLVKKLVITIIILSAITALVMVIECGITMSASMTADLVLT